MRDVPAPESGQEFVVVGVEHAQDIDPRLVGTRRRGSTHADLVRRTHILAVVAAIDAIAECLAVLDREHAFGLHKPCQTSAGVDHPRFDDRPGWASVEARRAGATAVGDRRLVVGFDRCVGDHGAQHNQGADARYENVAALAPPADAGSVRCSPIDKMVLISDDGGTVAGVAQRFGDGLQRRPQDGVVVLPRVGRHPSHRHIGGHRRGRALIVVGANDQ